jgi:spermidine/putrescine-binding protein
MPMLTRRQALGGVAAIAAVSAITRSAQSATRELRMYTWDGYADAAWVKEFEETNNCKVNVAYGASVDEMFAKISGSKGADFDMIVVDTSTVPRYAKAGLIAPLDMAKIPNAANLTTAFKSVPVLQIDGKSYGVPFAWGSLGMIYDTEFFKGKEPDSWATLWNPEYEGRMISIDDANNSVVTAALLMGMSDPYNLTDDQLSQVKAKLIEQKKLLLSYYSGFDDGVEIWKKNKIVAMFALSELQAKKMIDQGLPVKYLIPKEKAIGWLDCMLLTSAAKEPDLAMAWMNFASEKRIGADMNKKSSYGNTTGESPGMDYSEKLSWLQPPEDFNKRVNLWTEVKASQ